MMQSVCDGIGTPYQHTSTGPACDIAKNTEHVLTPLIGHLVCSFVVCFPYSFDFMFPLLLCINVVGGGGGGGHNMSLYWLRQ